MNALTQIANARAVSWREVEEGIGGRGSWHAEFAGSAYVFVGGLAKALTEGDVLAVLSQCGEVVDVDIPRSKEPPFEPRGFAFVAYEDQRSTVLAVDNLNGATVAGRTIRVEHVKDYRAARAKEDAEGAAEDTAPPSKSVDAAAPSPLAAEPWQAASSGGGGSVFDLLRSTVGVPAAAPVARPEEKERRRRRRRREGAAAAEKEEEEERGEEEGGEEGRHRKHRHRRHRHGESRRERKEEPGDA